MEQKQSAHVQFPPLGRCLTIEAELLLQNLPTRRMWIQVLYSRVTTRAYSTQMFECCPGLGPDTVYCAQEKIITTKRPALNAFHRGAFYRTQNKISK